MSFCRNSILFCDGMVLCSMLSMLSVFLFQEAHRRVLMNRLISGQKADPEAGGGYQRKWGRSWSAHRRRGGGFHSWCRLAQLPLWLHGSYYPTRAIGFLSGLGLPFRCVLTRRKVLPEGMVLMVSHCCRRCF